MVPDTVEPLWNITLFAELTLTRSGVVTRRFRSRKVASLLAYLAFHLGRSCSREFLCELLWPDEDPLITRNRLRVTLASLRRQLEPPGVPFGAVLESVGNGELRLSPERVATDVAAFELAVKQKDKERAAALFRGPLVPTLYDEWILSEQERLSVAYEKLLSGNSVLPMQETPLPVSPGEKTDESRSAEKAVPHSPLLPLYLTRFIGRESERERVRQLVVDPEVRLVTILGLGGNGKTRLATESVNGLSDLAAFVPLADLWEARYLFEAICHSLQLPPEPGIEPLKRIAQFCRERQNTLIVLDNLEQIALSVAPLISQLLSQVPGLTLLVTSRRRLELAGEQTVSLEPLPLPEGASVEDLSQAASVRLFLDRAQSVRPDIQITTKNAPHIAAICRLLEGVPLALELAAARAGTLTPEQMRLRLEQNRGDLVSSRLDKEDRHRSLYAVIEWSYALLPPDLRRFFLSLSVFRGGWDLDAAEAVTRESQTLDFLSRLRGHSLVTSDGERFRLLETLRIWAEEKQGEAERQESTRQHSAYFLTRAERRGEILGGPQEAEYLNDLQANEANLRKIFEDAMQSTDTGTALRISLILNSLGRVRGSLIETEVLLHRALTLPYAGLEELRARVLHVAGTLAQEMRGFIAARDLLEQALQEARKTENPSLISRTLRSVADNALLENEYQKAQDLYQEVLTLQRKHGDERGAMQTLNSMAFLVLRYQGDSQTAHDYMEEYNRYFRRIGDKRMLAGGVYNLGELALERGEITEAEQLGRESLKLGEELEDNWQRLYSLNLLSRCAGQQGQKEQWRNLCQEAATLAQQLGDRISLAEALLEYARISLAEKEYTRTVLCLSASQTLSAEEQPQEQAAEIIASVKTLLPERSFRAAWKKGSEFSPDQAVALFKEPTSIPG
jgi:predicted ATPase